jgi:hypothetical protein
MKECKLKVKLKNTRTPLLQIISLYFPCAQSKTIQLQMLCIRNKVKAKVNLSLCLKKYHATEIYPLLNSARHHEDVLGCEGIAPHTLTSTVYGEEWSASRPGQFTPDTQCIGGWVDPSVILDSMGKEKNSIVASAWN